MMVRTRHQCFRAKKSPCSKFYPMQQIGPCSQLVHAANLHQWRWGLVPIRFMGQFAVWVNLLCIHCVLTFLHLNIDVDSQPPLVPICCIVSSLYESFHCVVTFLYLNIDVGCPTPLVPIRCVDNLLQGRANM